MLNLYDLLQVSPSASAKQIRKQYQQLSKIYHPDKNPELREKYIDIKRAYEILTDPLLREVYDDLGFEAVTACQNATAFAGL